MQRPKWVHSPRATRWLCTQGALLLIALYAIAWIAAYLVLGPQSWPAPGPAEMAVLLALALVIGVVTYALYGRMQRDHAEAELLLRQSETRAAANEAAARVARVVVREFAQPLSGAVAYSELLMTHTGNLTDCELRELEGVREGVLQLDRMLQSLRQATGSRNDDPPEHCIADDVVRHLSAPRPRVLVYSPKTGLPVPVPNEPVAR